jgi:hypothetical protein
MYGPSQPGHGDLVLAEFQAKLLADSNARFDPVEEHMQLVTRFTFRWAGLLILVVGTLLWTIGLDAALIPAVAMSLVALAVIWKPWARTQRR